MSRSYFIDDFLSSEQNLSASDSDVLFDLYLCAIEICEDQGHKKNAQNIIATLASTVGCASHIEAITKAPAYKETLAPVDSKEVHISLFGKSIEEPEPNSIFGTLHQLSLENGMNHNFPAIESFHFQNQNHHATSIGCVLFDIPRDYEPTISPIETGRRMSPMLLSFGHKAHWHICDLSAHALVFGIKMERNNIPDPVALRLASDTIIGVSNYSYNKHKTKLNVPTFQ